MARPRAADYDDKRDLILHAAASLFASTGYDRTSLTQIAERCGTSKALVYHYYANKEQLLVDIIRAHLSELVAVVAEADDETLEPPARLRAMVGALLEAYRDADAEHSIQIGEMKRLPNDVQAELKDMERELVRRFSDALGAACPHIAGNRNLMMPLTMSLFGMLNWKYMWFREGGTLTREAYADMVTRIILAGAGSVSVGFAMAPPRVRSL